MKLFFKVSTTALFKGATLLAVNQHNSKWKHKAVYRCQLEIKPQHACALTECFAVATVALGIRLPSTRIKLLRGVWGHASVHSIRKITSLWQWNNQKQSEDVSRRHKKKNKKQIDWKMHSWVDSTFINLKLFIIHWVKHQHLQNVTASFLKQFRFNLLAVPQTLRFRFRVLHGSPTARRGICLTCDLQVSPLI